MLDRPAPGIRRLLAPNPSAMTGPGTNGYIIGRGSVAVVDPGPDDPRHLAAWREALRDEEVSHILVTHAHRDHSELAHRLSDMVKAPVLGFGPPEAGRSATMRRLAAEGLVAGGEGVDQGFLPDASIDDGTMITGHGWTIEAIHTPGHFAGHLSFATAGVVLTGDHVLGWTSTLISPPDGDLEQFLSSCERLSARPEPVFLPGHGDAIANPSERLRRLVEHRRAREDAILGLLAQGWATVDSLVKEIYADTPPRLHPAAARNVIAHLAALHEANRLEARPRFSATARFSLKE